MYTIDSKLQAVCSLCGDSHPADAHTCAANPTYRQYMALLGVCTPEEIIVAARMEAAAEPARMAAMTPYQWLAQYAATHRTTRRCA